MDTLASSEDYTNPSSPIRICPVDFQQTCTLEYFPEFFFVEACNHWTEKLDRQMACTSRTVQICFGDKSHVARQNLKSRGGASCRTFLSLCHWVQLSKYWVLFKWSIQVETYFGKVSYTLSYTLYLRLTLLILPLLFAQLHIIDFHDNTALLIINQN